MKVGPQLVEEWKGLAWTDLVQEGRTDFAQALAWLPHKVLRDSAIPIRWCHRTPKQTDIKPSNASSCRIEDFTVTILVRANKDGSRSCNGQSTTTERNLGEAGNFPSYVIFLRARLGKRIDSHSSDEDDLRGDVQILSAANRIPWSIEQHDEAAVARTPQDCIEICAHWKGLSCSELARW